MWLDKLKEMKHESDLTTKEIAHLSKIPEPTLEKLFAGATKDPKLETMRQLVHFFGYTLDDLEDGPLKNRKSPSSITVDGLDGQEQQIITLVKKMSPEQKDFLLALLNTTLARNQGMPASDQVSTGRTTPK